MIDVSLASRSVLLIAKSTSSVFRVFFCSLAECSNSTNRYRKAKIETKAPNHHQKKTEQKNHTFRAAKTSPSEKERTFTSKHERVQDRFGDVGSVCWGTISALAHLKNIHSLRIPASAALSARARSRPTLSLSPTFVSSRKICSLTGSCWWCCRCCCTCSPPSLATHDASGPHSRHKKVKDPSCRRNTPSSPISDHAHTTSQSYRLTHKLSHARVHTRENRNGYPPAQWRRRWSQANSVLSSPGRAFSRSNNDVRKKKKRETQQLTNTGCGRERKQQPPPRALRFVSERRSRSPHPPCAPRSPAPPSRGTLTRSRACAPAGATAAASRAATCAR